MGTTVYAFNEVVTLDTHHCGECGVMFALNGKFIERASEIVRPGTAPTRTRASSQARRKRPAFVAS
jgi:hypothetical protein